MEIRLAVTPLARLRGLLLRPRAAPLPMPLLLAPARSVHTFGLRRPIDVVFLDADLTVVKVVHALKPCRVAGAQGAVAALELPAGSTTLGRGDRLVLRRGR